MNTSIPQLSISGPELSAFAGKLYTEYCKSVGGVAFNGDPLPSWEEFVMTPTKEKQVQAWLTVAASALEYTVHVILKSAPGGVVSGTIITDVAEMLYAEHYTISAARGIPIPTWSQLMSLPGNDREIARWIRLANKVSKALIQSVANPNDPAATQSAGNVCLVSGAKVPSGPVCDVCGEKVSLLMGTVLHADGGPLCLRCVSRVLRTGGCGIGVEPVATTAPAPSPVPFVPAPVCDVCGEKVSLAMSQVLHADGGPLCLRCVSRVLRTGGCGIGVESTSKTDSVQ